MKKSQPCENLREKQFWQKEQHRQRLWGKNKLGTFQGVSRIVDRRDGMRLEKWSGVRSLIGCISQIRPKCMVTNDPQISVAYSLYLSLILHSHCGLTVHLLHSGFQVDGAALIWDISGLWEEGKEKVKDHIIAFKLLCESGCATSIGQSKWYGQIWCHHWGWAVKSPQRDEQQMLRPTIAPAP